MSSLGDAINHMLNGGHAIYIHNGNTYRITDDNYFQYRRSNDNWKDSILDIGYSLTEWTLIPKTKKVYRYAYQEVNHEWYVTTGYYETDDAARVAVNVSNVERIQLSERIINDEG